MQRILIVVFTAACFGIAVYSRPVTRSGTAGVRANLLPATNQRMDVAQVLARAGIWGKDFPSLLTFLESWNRVNEEKIYVFPDRVVGATQHPKRETAQSAAARLADAMKAPRSTPKRQVADLLRGVPSGAQDQLRIEVIPFLPDDDFFHVAWSNPSLQFIKPGVSVSTVISRLGPPEKTTQVLIQNETERRPVVLTLHSYAGGAIVFAESDWSPLPATVDRVMLDVKAVTAALY